MRLFIFLLGALINFAAVAYADETIVDQKKLKFSPNEITISVGDTVKFTNSDPTAHQITVKSGGMKADSPLLPPKKEFKMNFPKAGEFTVGCHIHPRMKLNVTVK